MSLPIRQLVEMGAGIAFDLSEAASGSGKSVKRQGVYTSYGTGSYDPDSGLVTPNNITVQVTYLATPYSAKQIDGEKIKAGDEKVIVKTAELIEAGINDRSLTDTLTNANGKVWAFVAFTIDPTDQIVIAQARAAEGGSAGGSTSV